MKAPSTRLLALLAVLLAGCRSTPLPPDWQTNAHSALKSFSSAYLSGNTRAAELEFARARSEIASTGRGDLVARAELVRCATRVASLEFDNCAGFQALAQDASASERSYAAYLTGHWQGLNPALLPAQHRALLTAAGTTRDKSLVNSIEDPLSRLVAAGVLLQNGRLTPADIVAATETASAQGWRRPLLAWLGVQAQRAQEAGDRDASARVQRRIELVSKSLE
ncbi:hypothetical protein ACFQAT_20640 [Undibacterium arcticum]|uniref:Lipoprotein n=1 Tax=Undibacterium arcticum TaxID=1762892 RepID=A0ABV7EZT0_9BURK